MAKADDLRSEIARLVGEYYVEAFAKEAFVPGESRVQVSGRVFDAEDITCLLEATLDFWLTAGRFAAAFERQLASYLGVRRAVVCNSGSSANLLAVSALTSPKLGERRLRPGDEVITVAAGFPTTVTPIVQNGMIPVFVDIELGTYNVDVRCLEEAVGKSSRAVILAHTLGNPFDVEAVMEVVKRHDLWLIEDNCDALGSKYKGRLTGGFGDLAALSFYPAHHITMGEGGCVVTDSEELRNLVRSFRDWGRDCWCDPGQSDSCRKRFEWKLGDLPEGYDHKYTYSHLGYNLKVTDMQAAVGVAQLQKLPRFIERRKQNWSVLHSGLQPLAEYLLLPQPQTDSDPSWFGFPITVRQEAPFTRNELTRFLESRKIETRLLFGGNLIRQPVFKDVDYRVVGDLRNTDVVMNQTFWIGVYPGLSGEMLEFVIETIREFCLGRAS